MLPPIELTQEQYERLKIAHATKKFGHLETWKELFLFQYTIASKEQIIKIAEFARRKNSGENIILPLKNFGDQIRISKEK